MDINEVSDGAVHSKHKTIPAIKLQYKSEHFPLNNRTVCSWLEYVSQVKTSMCQYLEGRPDGVKSSLRTDLITIILYLFSSKTKYSVFPSVTHSIQPVIIPRNVRKDFVPETSSQKTKI